MKKIITITALIVSFTVTGISQNIDDALRYSQIFQTGTARFNSMAGAFSALGGDISSMSQNPAGLGVYRSSEISVTPMLNNSNSLSYFKSNNMETSVFDFSLSQFGLVTSISMPGRERGLLSLNFGYSMGQSNNFKQSTVIKGVGNNSSMADYWADIASNGYPDGGGFYSDELSSYVPDTYLAWNSFLIDTLPNEYTSYGSAFSNYGTETSTYGQTIKRVVESSGSSKEHAISFGANISDKLYLGSTIGITSFDFINRYQHIETVPGVLNLSSLLTDFTYDLTYSNSGTGFNFKIGAIYRPVESVRLAFAFHTPTVYRIEEFVSDNLSTHFSGTTSRRDYTNYSVSNDLSMYEYRLKTPARAIFGAAYQLGQIGLLSVDYELIDYSGARFSEAGDGYDYSDHNTEINSYLKTANNIRIGTEFRISRIYVRGGYAFYGSSWTEGDYNSNKNYNLISGGLGFRTGSVILDLSYSGLFYPQTYILYSAPNETAIADINHMRNMFALTFGYRF